METVVLYHIFEKKEMTMTVGEEPFTRQVVCYEHFLTTTDGEYAQSLCSDPHGRFVYTFDNAFYLTSES